MKKREKKAIYKLQVIRGQELVFSFGAAAGRAGTNNRKGMRDERGEMR